MELLLVVVLGLLSIAAAAAIGPRLRVASPLLLVVVGIAVSFLPFVPDVEVDPEWILAGILPPLLYASAISMPSMEFRREFGAISGLSIGLVVVSSVVLGMLFAWLIPDLGLALGIALGAIVSPTDAVATSIVKRVGVSPRIVTVLEGESLLNDASALVLLRAAIAGSAAAVSPWDVVGDFLFAVGVAVALGYVVGKANLWVRGRVKDPTVNTVISFTVPFLASLPADALGASGLVAAVVAGFVTGRGSLRSLSPAHRISSTQNWQAIALILEGAVFLLLGLELSTLLSDLSNEERGIEVGLMLALAALAAVLIVRAGYVAVTVWLLGRSRRRAAATRPRLDAMQQQLDAHDLVDRADEAVAETAVGSRIRRMRQRLKRKTADLDYFLKVPIGWREGTIIVWAGMRGAVTLAAAQTLPHDTPGRSLLVFTAFLVAAISLLVQGGTLSWLVRRVKPALVDHRAAAAERSQLNMLLHDVAKQVTAERGDDDRTGDRARAFRLEIIAAQRQALLEARDDGLYSSSVLAGALDLLDAEQISMELRGEARDEA